MNKKSLSYLATDILFVFGIFLFYAVFCSPIFAIVLDYFFTKKY